MPTERGTAGTADSMRISWEQYLVDLGTTVTLNKVTDTFDSYDRKSGSTTVSSTIKADIQWVDKKDIDHRNLGDVKIGDGMIFVQYNVTISIDDDNVEFDGEKYRIVSQIEGEQVGGDIVYKGYLIRRNAQS